MKLNIFIIIFFFLINNISFAEIEKSLIKCADSEYQKDVDDNFFDYMFVFFKNKKESEKNKIIANDSNFLFSQIFFLSEAGFSQSEIVDYFKEIEKKDFESLEDISKRTVISIKQNRDDNSLKMNLFIKQDPISKRKDNIYAKHYLLCKSKYKKNQKSFIEKWN